MIAEVHKTNEETGGNWTSMANYGIETLRRMIN